MNERIEINPDVHFGKPAIRGTRGNAKMFSLLQTVVLSFFAP